MAKTVSITESRDTLDIVVDGHKMTEVLSYKLEGSCGRSTLTLVTEITDSYDLKIGTTLTEMAVHHEESIKDTAQAICDKRQEPPTLSDS